MEQAGDLHVIFVLGPNHEHDIDQFSQVADPVPVGATTAVALAGPGGVLLAGLRIGEEIRRRGSFTIVPDGLECVSARALAWLGGVGRYVDGKGRVGFHGAGRVSEDGALTETGQGNALVGAYLTRLGYPEATVPMATTAAPHDVLWLTPDVADDAGIVCGILDLDADGAGAAAVLTLWHWAALHDWGGIAPALVHSGPPAALEADRIWNWQFRHRDVAA